MNKQITLMLMVALCCLGIQTTDTISAQPVISNNNMPDIGETYTIKVVKTSGLLISQGPAGPDLTWSFEDLVSDSEHTVHFRSPEETPHATTFGEANYVMEYVPAIRIGTPQIQYHFFNNSNEILDELGRVHLSSSSQLGTVVPFNDALKWLTYDWTYESQLEDTFESTYTSNGAELYREGETVVKADGYGSLNLPYGRFDDVLRLKVVTTYRDKLVESTAVFEFEEESYIWISPKYAMPLLTLLREEVLGGPGHVLTVIYMENLALADELVGVKEEVVIASDVQFAPNPTQDFIQVQYHLTERTDIQINVYNELGQVVKMTQQGSQSTGRFQNTIDVQDFPRGLYLVELRAGQERIVEKVLVQ